MRPRNLFLLIIIIFCSCSSSKTNYTRSDKTVSNELTDDLAEVFKLGNFNGASLAIVNEKGTLYEHGLGLSDVAAQKKYSDKTIQNVGSISKTLVGIALLKAQELGKLKLDDPINKYLPFKVINPFYPDSSITIRQLATHTSTITDNKFYLKRNYILKQNQSLENIKLSFEDEQVFNPYDSLISMETYLQRVLSSDGMWYEPADFLKHKPGEIFEYSNVATSLAAYIIERATNTTFTKFTETYILAPLKMNASGWRFDDVDLNDHSRLYYTTDTLLPLYSLITYPDGNFITSSHDLAKFLTELIKGYSGMGTLLSHESYKTYFTQQLSAKNFIKRNEKNPYSDEYNLGIFIGFSVAGNIGHTGGDPGVATMMFFDPATKIGRILIVNTNINDKKGNDEFYKLWDRLGEFQSKFSN